MILTNMFKQIKSIQLDRSICKRTLSADKNYTYINCWCEKALSFQDLYKRNKIILKQNRFNMVVLYVNEFLPRTKIMHSDSCWCEVAFSSHDLDK